MLTDGSLNNALKARIRRKATAVDDFSASDIFENMSSHSSDRNERVNKDELDKAVKEAQEDDMGEIIDESSEESHDDDADQFEPAQVKESKSSRPNVKSSKKFNYSASLRKSGRKSNANPAN